MILVLQHTDELSVYIESIFQEIQQAGVELSKSNYAIDHLKSELLGRSINSKGVATMKDKTDKFHETIIIRLQ